jgi:cation diffusion facilitator CzcD-associated flavoprotein CzcO
VNRSTPPSELPLEWLIVGGGVHGVHLAIRLLDAGLASTRTLAILDPEARPLVAWMRRAERIGMRFLRSPIVHHLAPRPADLTHFLDRTRPAVSRPATRGPNRRPSLELFHAHVRHLADEFDLGATWRRGRALGLRRSEDGSLWTVETDDGSFRAARVALALGAQDALGRPAWADIDGPRVSHLLDVEAVVEEPVAGERVAIVGGGLTAGHAAVRWAEAGAEVVIISRHPVRVARYDTEPGWLGPKNMRGFGRLRSLRRRREAIGAARNRGTMTSDVARNVQRLRDAGRIRWVCAHVRSCHGNASEVSVVLGPVDGAGPDGQEAFSRGRAGGGSTTPSARPGSPSHPVAIPSPTHFCGGPPAST